MKTWTVQDAKAHLSELLRRARAGEPQRIGVRGACVVVSEDAWQRREGSGFGAYVVDAAPPGPDLVVPSRASQRPDPFAGVADDDA